MLPNAARPINATASSTTPVSMTVIQSSFARHSKRHLHPSIASHTRRDPESVLASVGSAAYASLASIYPTVNTFDQNFVDFGVYETFTYKPHDEWFARARTEQSADPCSEFVRAWLPRPAPETELNMLAD